MARYTGPRTKKARALGEAIFGADKAFEKRKYPPGQHGGGNKRRRQKSDYALQLMVSRRLSTLMECWNVSSVTFLKRQAEKVV